jgi:ABC-type branched-subunit amino acid transport system ATPase component
MRWVYLVTGHMLAVMQALVGRPMLLQIDAVGTGVKGQASAAWVALALAVVESLGETMLVVETLVEGSRVRRLD